MKNMGRHFAWRVRTQQEGKHFRVYYQHDYPHGTVETRDTRHFNSLAEEGKERPRIRKFAPACSGHPERDEPIREMENCRAKSVTKIEVSRKEPRVHA
jgi:hypothetical protein